MFSRLRGVQIFLSTFVIEETSAYKMYVFRVLRIHSNIINESKINKAVMHYGRDVVNYICIDTLSIECLQEENLWPIFVATFP